MLLQSLQELEKHRRVDELAMTIETWVVRKDLMATATSQMGS